MLRVDNEFVFIMYLNNKRIKQLNLQLKELIYGLYNYVDEDDIVNAWKNSKRGKCNIFISINGIIKGLCIKENNYNSFHTESIKNFCNFMYSLGASKEIVTKYLTYQFADGTINGHGLERMSLNQFRKYHLKEIKEINLFLNNEIIKEKAIDRFIIKGRKSYYAVDAIICGTPDEFRWISINDVKKMIMKRCKINDNVVHIGPLLCQPLNRCLNYNNRYSYGRYYVQIKWESFYDDLDNVRNYK